MKTLIDLGNINIPNSGDTINEGGQKINDHINDVYNTFADRRQPAEEQILQSTGVYQYVSYDNTVYNEEEGVYVYNAKIGEKLVVDMNGPTVRINLPVGTWAGSEVHIFRPTDVPGTTFVYSGNDGLVQNQEYVGIEQGVQYQFIASLDYNNDGLWSQRVLTASSLSSVTEETSVELFSESGALVIDCSIANYFVLNLSEHITNISFINSPTGVQSSTKILQINQPLDESWTIDLVSMGGSWSNNTYSDNLVNNTGLLAITFIAGNRFNTWVNSWFGLY